MKQNALYLFGALIIIAIFGSTLAFSAMDEKSRLLNTDLIDESTLAAMSINLSQVQALTGSDTDLRSPDYISLKNHLIQERKFIPNARFVYLVGQKPDGTLFFFADSEPDTSPDYSPPGQEYNEAAATFRPAFSGMSLITGPWTDSWGTWMTAMIPLQIPGTGVTAVLAVDIASSDWWWQIVMAGLIPVLASLLLGILLIVSYLMQERKENENRLLVEYDQILKQSEEKYRSLVTNSHDIMFTINTEGIITFVSDSWTTLLGYPIAQVIGRPCHQFIHPDDQNFIKQAIERRTAVAGIEFRVLHADGSWRWHVSNGSPVRDANGDIIGFEGSAIDITDRKQMEDTLKESEQRFHSLFENHDAIMLLIDPETGDIIDGNRAAARFYKISRAEINAHSIGDFNILPHDKIADMMEKARNNGLNTFIFPHRLADGEIRTVEVHSSPIDFGGKTVLFSIINDISDRVKAEAALEESNERFRQLAEVFPETIFESTPDGTITYANDHGLTQFGYTAEDIVNGVNIFSLVSPEFNYQVQHRVQEKMQGIDRGYLEYQAVRKDGSSFWAMGLSVPIIREGILIGIRGFVLDISRRKQMELSLQESEERYRAIYDQSPIAIELYDATGVLIHANPANMNLFGIEDTQGVQNFSLFSDPNIPEDQKKKVYQGENVQFQGMYDFEIVKNLGLYPTSRAGIIWISAIMTPLNDHNGSVSGYLVQILDITERKQIEEELLGLSERLSLAVRAGGVGIWDYDVVNNNLIWDDQMFALYGITSEQFSGAYEAWQAGIHPDDKARGEAEVQRALSGEKEFDTEFRVLWPDGSTHYIRALALVERDISGKPLRMVGTNWDITERNNAEAALRESEERLRIITQSMQFGIIIIDAKTHLILEANQKALEMIGVSIDEISGSICHSVICPAELGRCPITDLGLNVHSSERILLTKDGGKIPVLKTVIRTILGGSDVLIESFIDITERKKAEEALVESEKQYRDLFESSHDAIMTLDPPSWKFTTCNQATIELFGVASEEEFSSFSPWDISPEYQPDGLDSLCKARDMIQMALCKGSHYFEWTLSQIDGTEFPATVLLTRMDRYGVEYLQATIRDITQQKEIEDQINQIVQRLTIAAEAAHFGVWDLNLINNHLEWDDWMLRLYGINRENFNGNYENWQQLIHPDDLNRVREEVDQAIRGEKLFETEFRIIRPDGEVRYLKANAIVPTNRDHPPIRMTGINYDITDRKQYEWDITQYAEQLGAQNLSLEELSDELTHLNQELDEKVRERTEEISRLLTVKTDLITQIGHDLKTPLTSLIALLPYINRKVTDPDLRELLDVVTLDSKRMNQIISSILNLSAIEIKSPDELVGTSQVATIADRVISAEHLIINRYTLRVINRISPTVIVRMNEAHLDLILSNLIGNAVKFSKAGGTITISIDPDADTFCFIVQDDGQGIASDALPRIFEEFFKADSSRHDRDSHGLGLALVQRIVKSYGGTITAESEGIDMGTTVRVCFPVEMAWSTAE
ncbi:MAG TPA: PAS domain S-box protein [Methanospirillum sp.]|nr:PAS domain S-box protein [Methanospirillum sp.]